MNIILVTLLCAVAFGNPLDENKRLKRSNSVLLQALKEVTLLTQSELSVGSQAKETIITRRASEVIMIGDEIEIDILRVKASDHEVQFGVTAPAEISVHRKEVYDARHSETAVGMLIMSRKIGQTLMLGQDILFTVEDMRGGQVRFKVTAPADVAVLKKEIYMRDHSEAAKEEAVGAASFVNYKYCEGNLQNGGQELTPNYQNIVLGLSKSECAKRDDCGWHKTIDRNYGYADSYACIKYNKVCNDHPDARKAGQTCDTRWDHLEYWNARWEYCKNDKGTGSSGGCQYGYFDAGYNDECAGKYAAFLPKHQAHCN